MYLLTKVIKRAGLIVLFLGCASSANAAIQGVTGTPNGTNAVTFDLTTSTFNIPTPDGNSVRMWGYGVAGSPIQYPGPTMIVDQGTAVTVTLTNNNIPMKVSMLFPGQENVTAAGGTAGALTQESSSVANDTVTYTFTASKPGTYTYYSGTQPGLQIEMGLMGALIVRSTTAGQAYNDAPTIAGAQAASAYDREYLFILSEIDPIVHQNVEFGLINQVNNTVSHSTLWFMNGRLGPDTFFPDNSSFLPNQPYGSIAQMHPGERVLVRIIGGGREAHPFHLHGANINVFARDGRLSSSDGGVTADLAVSDYTVQTLPGATYDGIWQWTGEQLGWDIYGGVNAIIETPTLAHNCNGQAASPSAGFDPISHEYCPDHGKDIPVVLPESQELTYGGFWSGSPFLGALADLPPGEGGLNMNGGVFFMWHSHNERELTNDDIYPGGMMTMMIVEPVSAVIEIGNP
jgi:FtsP/CotA-like multicopper oxidase with cupredoxin domain